MSRLAIEKLEVDGYFGSSDKNGLKGKILGKKKEVKEQEFRKER